MLETDGVPFLLGEDLRQVAPDTLLRCKSLKSVGSVLPLRIVPTVYIWETIVLL